MLDGFAPYTKIKTSKGIRKIGDMLDGEMVKLMCFDGQWHDAKIKRHGKQELWCVTFEDEKQNLTGIVCTPNHSWLTRDKLSVAAKDMVDQNGNFLFEKLILDVANEKNAKRKIWRVWKVQKGYTFDTVWTVECAIGHAFCLDKNVLTADSSLL